MICELLILRVRRSGYITQNAGYSIFTTFLSYTGKQATSKAFISKYYE